MKKLILLVVIFEKITASEKCGQNKCSVKDDKYICPNVNLTFIPIGAMNVEVLDLSGNYFPQLDITDFDDFYRLKIISMSNVTLKVIHRDAFRKLKNLEELDLSINLLKFIHPDTFSETILQHLNLSGNIFKRLANYQFLTPHIRKLDLSNGFLEIISDTSFPNCSSLRWLNLSENKLKTISIKHLLLSCPRLEILMMHNNSWSCDCDFYLMAETPIIYDNSPNLQCDIDKEYRYANDTFYLKSQCEEYLKSSNSEIAIKFAERTNKGYNIQNLILHVYGYMLCGIMVLVFMCCCCKGQSVGTSAADDDQNSLPSAPIIDHLHFDDGTFEKQAIHAFEKCKVEIHHEDIHAISVENEVKA